MALEADTLIDRRRLVRRAALWRALAFILVLGAIAAFALREVGVGGPHVARLPITGAIVSDRPLVRLIERLGRDEDVAAVLVAIDSPGGTSVGGERLYEALRDLSAKKPVVAHINTLGASAAYMAALGTDQIVAHRSSLTGSIGVLIQYARFQELLDDLGVDVEKVASGDLKAEPNPFEATSPEAVAVLQGVVDDTYDWFLSLVVERRSLEEAEARRLADGRIFTGGQALAVGLIDRLGGEDEAIAYMVREREVPADLPLKTYEPRSDSPLGLTARVAKNITEGVLAAVGERAPSVAPLLSVDALISVWHAPGTSDRTVNNND